LDIVDREARREEGLGRQERCGGGWNSVAAIDKTVFVMTDDTNLEHELLELGDEDIVVADKLLPEARSPWIASEKSVRSKTEDSSCLEVTADCDGSTSVVLEQNLQEDLIVPDEWCRVEWLVLVGGVNEALVTSGVCAKKSDDLLSAESSRTQILHSGEDGGDILIGCWDQVLGRDLGGIRTAGEEGNDRTTRAESQAESHGELDSVAGRDTMMLNQRSDEVGILVETCVGLFSVGVGKVLFGWEEHNGTIGASAWELAFICKCLGETNSVVEGQAHVSVDIVSASVEEDVVQEFLANIKPDAASSVIDRLLRVGTDSALLIAGKSRHEKRGADEDE